MPYGLDTLEWFRLGIGIIYTSHWIPFKISKFHELRTDLYVVWDVIKIFKIDKIWNVKKKPIFFLHPLRLCITKIGVYIFVPRNSHRFMLKVSYKETVL